MINPKSNRFLLFVLLAGFVLFPGCRSFRGQDFPYHVARFYVETSEIYPEQYRVPVTLPYSEETIQIDPRIQIGEFDIVKTEVFEAELGKAVGFTLTPEAARDVRMLTYNNQGRRLVLLVNEVPMGARLIQRGIEDGVIRMYLEVPDDDLEELAEYIEKTSEEARRRL